MSGAPPALGFVGAPPAMAFEQARVKNTRAKMGEKTLLPWRVAHPKFIS